VLRSFRDVLPRVHPTAFIDESAQVIGDVEIGEESSVWMGVVVRGDVNRIRIGRRTNVQDGTIVHVMIRTHPTTIGDNVTIGHGAIVHGCTIGNRTLVGMGAIVLDGVEVGDECLIGAGALLTPGTRIAAGQLVVGSPAKAVRPLTAEERASLVISAANYARVAAEYRATARR